MRKPTLWAIAYVIADLCAFLSTLVCMALGFYHQIVGEHPLAYLAALGMALSAYILHQITEELS